MKLSQLELWASAVLFTAIANSSFCAQSDLQLGSPPLRPKDISSLPREPDSLLSGGFSMNTTNREEVRSFYNAIYPASDNVPMLSSADTAGCVAGTNSADFKDAVARRINWFRAMAGIPANITFLSANNTNDQLAALIMSASTLTSGGRVSHSPNSGGVWQCWSSAGSNAAYNSNLALGAAGAAAVTEYIKDADTNNAAVGHRRWLLYPQTQVMGTGDIPPQGSFHAANAIWVFDAHINDPRPATRARYIAWPPSGFVPKQTVYPRWSFAYTNANFNGATINMTSNGVAIAVAKESVDDGYGEPTLVWVPMGLDAKNFQTPWPFNGSDTVYTVAISNVLVNGSVSNFNYSVTIFDPAVPGANYFPPVISGPAQPFVGQNNFYTFNSVSNTTSYQWRYAQRMPFSFFDGAEGTLSNWTTNTESDYSVITTDPVASGTHAFQLIHSRGNAQSITLNYTVSPLTNAVLQFKSRLEYAFTDEVARVQISTNGGAAWFDVFTQAGTNTLTAQGPGEGAFSTKNINLGPYATNGVQIRFLYDVTPSGLVYTTPPLIVGWHFDDITIVNAEQLLTPVTNAIASTSFQFSPPQGGNYNLQARGVIFTDFPLDWGPVKQVVAVTNPATVIAINKISVSNNQTKVDFTLQSGSAATYKLLTAAQPFGSWSTDTLAVLTTNSPGSFRFTTTPSGNVRFYRIQTP